VSGNLAGRGGGIWNQSRLDVLLTTITNNVALTEEGSGIYSFSIYARDLQMLSSIVTGNAGSDIDSRPNYANAIYSLGHNLVGTGNATAVFNQAGDQSQVLNPLLGPLADNGGFALPDGSHILTHALLAGSPAINAGDLAAVAGQNGVPQFDERGTPFGRVFGGRIDIGAFEYQAPSDLNLLVDTLVDESDGNYSRSDLSLREAIELANLYPGADTIHFDPALTASGPAKIDLTLGELAITDALAIDGPGADTLTIDASGNDPTPNSRPDDANTSDDGDGSLVIDVSVSMFNDIFLPGPVSISGLTLTGADSSGNGGALLSDGILILSNMVIRGNAARYGGGVYSSRDLTVLDSRIESNVARIGGGIYSFGRLLIARSTISENVASGDPQQVGTDSSGGGVFALNAVEITDSHITANVTSGSGGGIAIGTTRPYIPVAAAAISSSEITDNVAADGGGIAVGTAANPLYAFTIESSSVLHNSATLDGGGILANVLVQFQVSHSYLAQNSAGSDGGGINVRSTTIDIFESEVSENTAAGNGGGLWMHGVGKLEAATIAENGAGHSGGGVWWEAEQLYSGAPIDCFILSSTISGNKADETGGGLFIENGYGVIISTTVQHSTIALNSAGNYLISGLGAGGGVFVGEGVLGFDHTILAENDAIHGPDLTGLFGVAISMTNSLLGNSQASGFSPTPAGSADGHGNLIGGAAFFQQIDPKIGPLADNGGFTLPDGSHILTHALLAGSPAINAGDPAAVAGVGGVPASDQRGVPFTRVFGGRIDIGAVEREPIGFLAGDYDGNRVVDLADYSIWRDTMGTAVPPGSGADGNGDGFVNQLDYEVWKTNFGTTLPAAGAASMALSQPLRAPAAATRPEVGVAAILTSTLDRAPSKPPAEPGAAGLLAMRVPFTTAARRDLLFEAWLAKPDDRSRQSHDTLADPRGDALASNDSTADLPSAVDSAFALLGLDGM
jgi:hypothetical protein